MMDQLKLFDQDPSQSIWTSNDIWTPAWNLALNLAIVTACSGKWLQLKDMTAMAVQFGLSKELDPPFAMQVYYLSNIGRLKIRTDSKKTEFMTA